MFDPADIDEALGDTNQKTNEVVAFGNGDLALLAEANLTLIKVVAQLADSITELRRGLESVQEKESQATAAAMAALLHPDAVNFC